VADTKRTLLGFVAALIVLASPFARADAQSVDQVGDAYEIIVRVNTDRRGDGSSGSSNSFYMLVERVIALRDGGVELEFDFPNDPASADRSANWQFPVRVFKPAGEPFQLLNAEELRARNRAWLASAQIPEEACGRWVFTWTAIKIECDPQSVLGTLEMFDLRPLDTSESVDQIDPEAVRRERAETDVTVREMMNEPSLTLDAALEARADEQYSGTISSRYETDTDGRVIGRTVTSELQVTEVDGSVERVTTTTTIDRRRVTP
jgi:hypothetical protein